MIVVEVEAGLPDRDHSRIPQHATEPGFGARAPVPCVVRVDAGRCHQPRLGSGQLECSLCAAGGLADDNHAADSGSPGPIQHLFAIGLVGGIGKVTVGIDQHGGKTGETPLPAALPLCLAQGRLRCPTGRPYRLGLSGR